MKLYITNKIYNMRYGDLVPLVTSNALNTGIVILEKMNNGEHDVHIVQPKECISDCTKLIYLYKCGDHYDACLPKHQAERQHFVDIQENVLPLVERNEIKNKQNDCIDPPSRQVKVSCSVGNFNCDKSKMYLIISKTKQNLVIWIPEAFILKLIKLDALLIKSILTFSVSVKLGYINT